MSNPYAPPRAPLDEPPGSPQKSPDFRRKKNATRPLGVVLVVALFFIFSGASTALLILEGEQWWIGHGAISLLIAYWFRNLWWGDDKERKIAVFIGFFMAALTVFGSPEGDLRRWSTLDLVSAAEGCYFLLSAVYLIYAKRTPFFAKQPAL